MEIPDAEYAVRYRIAARGIGFRYAWRTLEYRQGTQRDNDGVLHYIRLIRGEL